MLPCPALLCTAAAAVSSTDLAPLPWLCAFFRLSPGACLNAAPPCCAPPCSELYGMPELCGPVPQNIAGAVSCLPRPWPHPRRPRTPVCPLCASGGTHLRP